jgi:hydroxypyruvate isomerase
MLSFSANLSMLFTEVEFLERFSRASKAGFRAVECQFPYAYRADQLADQLEAHRLALVLHNLPAGNWAAGERGIACLPGRTGEFQDGVGRAIEYATALRCTQLNCLAGIAPAGASRLTLHDTFIDNLRFAGRELKKRDITLLVEPLNTRDTPGFFLETSQQSLEIIESADIANLRLQFDVYHMHIMEGDVVRSLQRSLSYLSHLQVADDPGRHEPGTGTIDFPSVFQTLESAKYGEWIGCEYVPSRATEETLGWLSDYFNFPASAS